MALIKEYNLLVNPYDYINNFAQSKRRIKRFAAKMFEHVGYFSMRVTIDVIMEKSVPVPKTQSAGFRSFLEPIRRTRDVDSIVESKFSIIENSIDGYNKNGMSGCVVKEIINVRVLVVKQRLYHEI